MAEYPELNLDILERYAERWIQNYLGVDIERVILTYYHMPSKYQVAFVNSGAANGRIPQKYLIAFEVTGIDKILYDKYFEFDHYQSKKNPVPAAERKKCEAYHKLMSDTGTSSSDAQTHLCLPFIDAAFIGVYKNPPPPDYKIEQDWGFTCVLDLDELTWVDPSEFYTLLPKNPDILTPEIRVPFAFYKEGPSWTITYEGRTARGLGAKKGPGSGFDIIYLLISNPGNNFELFNADLRSAANLPPFFEGRGQGGEMYNTNYDRQESKSHAVAWNDKSDPHTRGNILKKIKELKTDMIADPQNQQDYLINQETEEEIKALQDELNKLTCPDGYKTFSDERDQSYDNYRKKIYGALKEIKRWNDAAFEHFDRAIKRSINGFSYSSNPPINWRTEPTE